VGKLATLKKLPTPQNILKGKEAAEESLSNPEEVEDLRRGTYTEPELLKAWEEFAAQRKMDLKDLEYHVMQQPIQLLDNKVLVTLTNPVQEDILTGFKSELILYLREKLGNGQIGVEGQLVEPEKTQLIYTNREKFQYLAEKKPILQALKDRLDLDPDF
jgi:hypothetical protein